MPRRPRSHQLEDLAINRLHIAFETIGWTVEDLAKDYGEDLFVRLFEGEITTPLAFFVQSKATDTAARYKRQRSKTFAVPVETGHLRHWVRFSEPVFLTFWDAAEDCTYWVCVQDAAKRMKLYDTVYARKSVSIPIPHANRLDSDGLQRIRGITRMRFERSAREQEGAKFLLEMLEKKSRRVISGYDPDVGILTLKRNDGGADMVMFGDMAERLDDASKKCGLTPRAIMGRALKFALDDWSTKSKAALKRQFEEREADRERKAGAPPNLRDIEDLPED